MGRSQNKPLADTLRRQISSTCGRIPGKAWTFFVIAGMTIYCIYVGARVYRDNHAPWGGDFGVYYRAGQDMAAGRPLYNLDRGNEEIFKAAPVEALALTAIQGLPPAAARQIWYLADLSLLGAIFALSYRMIYPDGRWTARRGWLTLATFAVTSGYCMNQLTAGQTTTLWVALSMLAFWWLTQGRPARAGLALAAAICVKLVPICFLPYLVLCRVPLALPVPVLRWLRHWQSQWHPSAVIDRSGYHKALGLCRDSRVAAALSFAASLLALLLIPAGWVGWDANIRLLVEWSHHVSGTLTPEMFSRIQNESLFAVLLRFLSPTEHGVEMAALDFSTVGRVWLVASCVLGAALYGWCLLALRSPQTIQREATMLALLLIFMTACNPLGWRQNCVALIFPYFLVLDSIARSSQRRRTLLALWIPSVLIIYVRGHSPSSIQYVLQVYGGRFWANGLLAAAALVAYHAANSRIEIGIAGLPDAEPRSEESHAATESRQAASVPVRRMAA